MIAPIKPTAEAKENLSTSGSALTATANGSSGIAALGKVRMMLERAETIEDIHDVENLAQLACEYAKKARLGGESINAAARLTIDARRKTGSALTAMIERGELAGPGKRKTSQRATFTLGDLGLTRSQSFRYRQESSVPPDVYEKWVQRVTESADGVLNAYALRDVARRLREADGRRKALRFAAAAGRIRRSVETAWQRMGGGGRARLPEFLKALSGKYEGIAKLDSQSKDIDHV